MNLRQIFDTEQQDEQSQRDTMSRRRMVLASSGLATALCGTRIGAGVSAADSPSEPEQGGGRPAAAEECDGTSFKQVRPDGLDREVQLSQSIQMVYYGQSELPSGDGYLHEFAVEGLGSTRFSYKDEEFRRSYNAELSEAEFTIGSREGHDIDDIEMYGPGVPEEGSYTSSDVLIDGAEAASNLLLKRAPQAVQWSWKAVQVAAALHEDTNQVDSRGSTISRQWTMNYFTNNFGYDGQQKSDMAQYVRFFVYLPKADENAEVTQDTLDIEMQCSDDKGREHGTEMSYGFKNPE